jgi:hypothetical protein
MWGPVEGVNERKWTSQNELEKAWWAENFKKSF